MAIDRNDLVRATNAFFALHWPESETPPEWSDPIWTGIGPVPNHNVQGCYALVREEEITYIGSGFGRGSALRPGFGLSRRLAGGYLKRDRSRVGPGGEKVYQFRRGYTGAYTIGFPRYAYLAISLEHYLIGQLAAELPDNKIKIFKAPKA